ncbi:MAG TPA: VOC family protein [Candidatus Dormibacteraeota bacterium]
MSTAIKPPNYRTGKICYIEIPATDVEQSAEFYRRAFGWQTRQRGDGSTAFDDTVNEVSGTWVVGRQVAAEPGLMVYIMVANAADAVKAVASAGGEIVHHVDPHAREVVATFRDPAGNLIGIYQQPGLAEAEARESAAVVHQFSD